MISGRNMSMRTGGERNAAVNQIRQRLLFATRFAMNIDQDGIHIGAQAVRL